MQQLEISLVPSFGSFDLFIFQELEKLCGSACSLERLAAHWLIGERRMVISREQDGGRYVEIAFIDSDELVAEGLFDLRQAMQCRPGYKAPQRDFGRLIKQESASSSSSWAAKRNARLGVRYDLDLQAMFASGTAFGEIVLNYAAVENGFVELCSVEQKGDEDKEGGAIELIAGFEYDAPSEEFCEVIRFYRLDLQEHAALLDAVPTALLQ